MKQRSYKHWTKLEERKLIELRENKGLKYNKIAELMNRSPLSVEKHYRKVKAIS
ncbi:MULTISPECIES: SANT/Myb-like DNA-binding domain-containing protein [Metabacillus]|uniref:SANT/Myb-like DNA-binding domain-containing protein n=1 Tax=Metabacillus TaxID=2675233 RepID=UPI000C810478|nr:hypothetical protein CJ195_22045 [Bacillus sp. UMB0899]